MKKKTKKRSYKKVDPYKVIESGLMLVEQNIKSRGNCMGPFELLSHVAFTALAKKALVEKGQK